MSQLRIQPLEVGAVIVVIPGQPVGKGRPRFARAGDRVRTYTPRKTAEWEADAVAIMRRACDGCTPSLDVPVVVIVAAVCKRPNRLMRRKDPESRMWRTTKPDGDNVLKAVCDAMVKAGIVVDDTHLVDKRVMSLYAAKNEAPCVEVYWSLAPEKCP